MTDIREHLAGLSTAFSEGNHIAAPDPTICHATEFPAEFKKLDDQWGSCLRAASVINTRYYADWNKGGAITVIAPRVREVALDELTDVWKSLTGVYISQTVETPGQT